MNSVLILICGVRYIVILQVMQKFLYQCDKMGQHTAVWKLGFGGYRIGWEQSFFPQQDDFSLIFASSNFVIFWSIVCLAFRFSYWKSDSGWYNEISNLSFEFCKVAENVSENAFLGTWILKYLS